ncbi:hypothetical protein JWJ90_10760 [Desulfobulbus rhabdoformis]|uniref:hypothetical protein n=1 Tax=Desulfobulbus rhabdoformis TaxID=34032 RepID=UPI001964E03F|nr:hypothetical protein [Desulfobulbus rhabdoformis]MBM9614764.1 hypothetical protein [Desulfobulbus rhabdoformis]
MGIKINPKKTHTMDDLTVILKRERNSTIGEIDDNTFSARCVLHFVNSVFRELAGNMSHDSAEAYFHPKEINGLFLTMDQAMKDLEAGLALEDKKEVEA